MAITVQEAQVVFSADGLNQVKTKAGEAGRALDKTTTAAGGLIGKLKSVRLGLGGIGSTIAGLGVGAAAGGMMALASGAEQTAIAFEVLLGSASKSKEMIDNLRKLDMKTVFGMRELGDAAKMMLNFGVAGEEVVPVLSMITDIAAGDAMKLEGMTRAFGQMSGAGRLMGQDLNQMINAGFSPLQEISKRTGESMAVLKKRMEDGLVPVSEVRQAFVDATSAGGRFAGMNDRMSRTTGGQFAKLKSEVELLTIAIGTELLPEANKLIEWSRKLFESTGEIKTKFSEMKDAVKSWFTDAQEKFMGVGVIVGVTAVHMVDIFRAAFADIQSVAAAAFAWIGDNAGIMVDNMAARMRAIKQMLLGQEVTEFLTPVGGFTMPESKLGKIPSLRSRIDEELEATRKARQLPPGEKKVTPEDETRNELKRKGTVEKPRFQSEGKSQTLSAEALFSSLRESALNKQIGIAQQSLGVQQDQLAAQQVMIAAIGNINMGLA